ncbi:MAG: hypothetical protein Phyf2KO_19900 [Phycisphaerales bacterium]
MNEFGITNFVLTSFRKRKAITLLILMATLATALAVVLLSYGIYYNNTEITTAGSGLLSTFGLFTLIIIVIRFASQEPDNSLLQTLRATRFETVTNRVKVSISLHLSPQSARHRKLANELDSYNPSTLVAELSEQFDSSFINCYGFHPVPEDNALWIVFDPHKHLHNPVSGSPLFTVSVWQLGDEVRLGVFIHSQTIALITSAERDSLLDKIRNLFFIDDVRVENRHDSLLLEISKKSDRLLLNPVAWDLIAAEVAHVTIHTSIATLELLDNHNYFQVRSGPNPGSS